MPAAAKYTSSSRSRLESNKFIPHLMRYPSRKPAIKPGGETPFQRTSRWCVSRFIPQDLTLDGVLRGTSGPWRKPTVGKPSARRCPNAAPLPRSSARRRISVPRSLPVADWPAPVWSRPRGPAKCPRRGSAPPHPRRPRSQALRPRRASAGASVARVPPGCVAWRSRRRQRNGLGSARLLARRRQRVAARVRDTARRGREAAREGAPGGSPAHPRGRQPPQVLIDEWQEGFRGSSLAAFHRIQHQGYVAHAIAESTRSEERRVGREWMSR